MISMDYLAMNQILFVPIVTNRVLIDCSFSKYKLNYDTYSVYSRIDYNLLEY